MSNDLMHELHATRSEILEEPELFRQAIAAKQRLIRRIDAHVNDLVGFKTKCPAAVKQYETLATFLNLMMGDVAIDRTAADFEEFGKPQDWFDVRILANIAPGKGVALREDVELYRKGATPGPLAEALADYWESQRRCADPGGAPAGAPRPVRIHEFSAASFSAYGRSLALEDEAVFPGVLTDERFYTGRVADLPEGETWELGRLVADTRTGGQFFASQCDSHRKTDELLVPDCDCLLTVDRYRRPEKSGDGRLLLDYFQGEVFLVRRGQPVLIRQSVAHTAPTRLGYGGALTTPVLFRKGTTEGPRDARDIEIAYFRKRRLYLAI
jgi:hypothetical protein